MAKITEYRIVISENAGATDKRAAAFLCNNIKLVCGRKIPIVTDATVPSALEIAVGKTRREEIDGVKLKRSRDNIWEYELFTAGSRFYLTGLGTAPDNVPFVSSYKTYDDGQVGTAHAAAYFTEKILGYNFLFEPYCTFPENPELEMPAEYHYSYTKEARFAQMPEKKDGAAMYVLPRTGDLEWQMCSIIFRTKAGKLIVVDGGAGADSEHVLRVLEYLSDGKKPVITAWFFSHMHEDHFGVYWNLLINPELARRITVENFYCNLLSEDFYTKNSAEPSALHGEIRALMLDSEKLIGAKVKRVEKGDIIPVDEFSFEVLITPDEGFGKKMNMNDSSVVYKLNYNNEQTMMLLGDAEWICSNALIELCADKLKSDIVQVGHHGCGNVSQECYRLIDAEYYIWQISPRFWYSDGGDGLNTRNTGLNRTRTYIGEIGGKPENNYQDIDGILSFSLPINIH